ncbi:MAG: histidine--tRNA ligase [Lentisphaerae bacterium RIFOXYA12_FULL_48_11]|nr:MAG: histidine--tRNA ligase [Lentisphaerae bacterium RIFOXYA12_FULL_48_11]
MSQGDSSFNPPRGMRDFYPEDMAVRNAIFNAWTRAATRFGFQHYDSCVVESLELLKRKAGEEIVDQIYTFTDKSNRELALRAEMTPTLARMVAARQGSLSLPLKWFAIAQCFRYERMTKGRKREHYQWNLDIIGEPSVAAEAEVIATAICALGLLGLAKTDFRIHFNSRAILSLLLESIGIPAQHHQSTFLVLDKRGKISSEEMQTLMTSSGLDRQNIDKIFSLAEISTLDQVFEKTGDSPAACQQVLKFLELANVMGIKDSLVFDISVIRGLSYYTGIVFEGFDAGKSYRAIFGGGRYDNLMSDIGGSPMTGVGLGFGDVVVAEILAEAGKSCIGTQAETTAIGFMEDKQQITAVSIASALRRKGTNVDLATRNEKPKSFFSRTGKLGFKQAIYIGPDDIIASSVRIKDLATRNERIVPISEILA